MPETSCLKKIFFFFFLYSGDVHASLVDLDTRQEVSTNEKWPSGFLTQFCQLAMRSFKQSKAKLYSKFKIFETVFLCVLLSLIWFQLPRSENTLRDRMGLVSVSVIAVEVITNISKWDIL